MRHVCKLVMATLPLVISFGALANEISPECVKVNPNWPNPNASREELRNPENWPSDWIRSRDGKPYYEPEWEHLSFVPASHTAVSLRPEEIEMGTGIHNDRAWQLSVGRHDVIIAVLDSGIKWNAVDLLEKHYLNIGELPPPQNAEGKTLDQCLADASCECALANPSPYDLNCDGKINIRDYAYDPRVEFAPVRECNAAYDCKGNRLRTPQDLIFSFSDGVDDDNNGFIDDISGWDFFWNDNDPYDDTCFGHGTGEAQDSAAQGNNGNGGIGGCPECMVLNMRVGDSFICDINHYAAAVVYAVDNGASLVQEALGTINWNPYAQEAMDYAWKNNVLVVASAADETSYHHNPPGNGERTLYVHSIVYDGDRKAVDLGDFSVRGFPDTTSFLNFCNCTNFGAHLTLSAPGEGCSSEATGRTSGHVGLLYSYAKDLGLDPPLSAAEAYQIMILSADDINIPGGGYKDIDCYPPDSETCNPNLFPSGPGWDAHFGYGRNNAYNSLMMLKEDKIPPEVYITYPRWFEVIYTNKQGKVEIKGEINARRHESFDWELEWAPMVTARDYDFKPLASGKGVSAPIDGTLIEWDISDLKDVPGFYQPGPLSQNSYAVTVRLKVTAQKADGKTDYGEFRKSFFILDDPDIREGFPIDFNASGEASPTIADIDGDCKDEIILPLSDGYLYVIEGDGTVKWKYKLPLVDYFDPNHPNNHLGATAYKGGHVPNDYGHAVLSTVAVGDLDGDGSLTLDIVVASVDGTVVALDYQGSELWRLDMGTAAWPTPMEWYKSENTSPKRVMEKGFFSSPVLYDLDGDGKLEIIIGGLDSYLYVFTFDGSVKEGFPVKLIERPEGLPKDQEPIHARLLTTAAIGDINGDGTPEIVMASNEDYGGFSGRAYAVKHNGNLNLDEFGEPAPFLKGWPIEITGVTDILPYAGEGVPFSAALADVDRDGNPDVAIGTIMSNPAVYNYEGKRVARMVTSLSEFGEFSNSDDGPVILGVNSGSFGDLDGKAPPEYVNGTVGLRIKNSASNAAKRTDFQHQVSAWGLYTDPSSPAVMKGKFMPGFPRHVEDYQFFMNYIIVDLDNDGFPEIISGTGGYVLNALNMNGDQPEGWPKFTGQWILASAAIGDLDGDGLLDVVVNTRDGWLYAWKTKAKIDSKLEWPSYHHNIRNTGNYHHPIDWRANPQCAILSDDDDDDSGDDDDNDDDNDVDKPDAGTPDSGKGQKEEDDDSSCSCRVR